MSTSRSSPSDRTRVLIVDDHPAICQTLAKILDGEMDMTAVETAGSAEQALSVLDQTEIDVAIIDLSLPDSNGLELISRLQQLYPNLPTLVYSRHDERIYAERALQAGAQGYLMKTVPPDKIITAIRTAEQGRIYLSEEMRTRSVQHLTQDYDHKAGLQALSEREQAVFEGLGRGESLEEISTRLGITLKTAEHHRRQAKEKLGLETTGQLLQHAIAWVQSHPDNMEEMSS